MKKKLIFSTIASLILFSQNLITVNANPADVTPPCIAYSGADLLEFKEGQKIDVLKDVSGIDETDGVLEVTATPINPSLYHEVQVVTYTCVDKSGNVAQLQRNVIVNPEDDLFVRYSGLYKIYRQEWRDNPNWEPHHDYIGCVNSQICPGVPVTIDEFSYQITMLDGRTYHVIPEYYLMIDITPLSEEEQRMRDKHAEEWWETEGKYWQFSSSSK